MMLPLIPATPQQFYFAQQYQQQLQPSAQGIASFVENAKQTEDIQQVKLCLERNAFVFESWGTS